MKTLSMVGMARKVARFVSQTGAQAARRSSVDICRSSSMVLVLAAALTFSRIAPFSERGRGSETKLPFAVPDCRMARWW
jgi:hypothetical protein